MADRCPRPWTIKHNDDAYWVEDAQGMRFAYTYFRDRPAIGTGREQPTRELARRVTVAIARLGGPEPQP